MLQERETLGDEISPSLAHVVFAFTDEIGIFYGSGILLIRGFHQPFIVSKNLFYGKEDSGSGEVLEPIDIQPYDDGGGSEGIVIIEGSIPTDEVITLPPPSEPPIPIPVPFPNISS